MKKTFGRMYSWDTRNTSLLRVLFPFDKDRFHYHIVSQQKENHNILPMEARP